MEFISGIKRQLREGKLTPEPAAEILQVFARDEANDVWLWLPMDDALLDATCAAFQNLPPAVHLRAGDALHLTCARVQGNLQQRQTPSGCRVAVWLGGAECAHLKVHSRLCPVHPRSAEFMRTRKT